MILQQFFPDQFKAHKILAQIYQAIRIEVNQEMDVLKEFLEQSLDILNARRKIKCDFISFIRRQIGKKVS